MTPSHRHWMPSHDFPPFGMQGLLLAVGLVAAIGLLVAFVDVLHQSAERGDRLRAAQAAHREALATRDPRAPRPAPAHLTVAQAEDMATSFDLPRP